MVLTTPQIVYFFKANNANVVEGFEIRHLDLFSGIGGFALAARWVGWRTIGFVEIDSFCQKVLKKHWPGVQIESDIKQITANTFRECPDVITGGFPCQPFSIAGKRRGTADDRHLWPEMVRVISEIRPTWVIAENVTGFLSLVEFDRALEVDSEGIAQGEVGDVVHRTGRGIADEAVETLESLGYSVQSLVIPACGVDARHRRNRVWIIAYSASNGFNGRNNLRGGHVYDNEQRNAETNESTGERGFGRASETGQAVANAGRGKQSESGDQTSRSSSNGGAGIVANAGEQQRNGRSDGSCRWSREPLEALRDARRRGRQEDGFSIPESLLGRVADGIPRRVDRLRSLGNAIVPQVAFEIFRAIQKADQC